MSYTLSVTATRFMRRALRAPLRSRVAAGMTTLAFVLIANPAAARTVFPIGSGSGDSGFEDRCPANQYMTGLAGRAGNWIDQIRILCAPVRPDGTQGTTYDGPSRGGTGGAALEYSCAGDAFMTGVNLHFDDKYSRVTDVDFTCTSMRDRGQATFHFGEGGSALETLGIASPESCPNGELASGFAGRYGHDVNALGLFCDARVMAVAPAPAASHYPIRLTGKQTLPCPSGFVWREASPTDHVCVTPMQRRIATAENAAAAGHVDSSNQTYGPNTCVQGYVWREAYSGDVVCVTPQQRDAAAAQNQNAPASIPAL